MNIFDYNSFYLVGIKGVGMTTLAQLLIDAGKIVSGCDLEEDFVTKPALDSLEVKIDHGFQNQLADEIDCVIYTAAHQGENNPQVQNASAAGKQVVSHAEALGSLFNQKKGIAVCGVGGKSSTSAMLAWIFEKTGRDISYAVGVAEINGLGRSGKWSSESEYFIAEADEYVTDPSAAKEGREITPRFSYLNPHIVVSKKIVFDHPDAYRDFNHTLEVFNKFFAGMKPEGTLIIPEGELEKGIEAQIQTVWEYGPDGEQFISSFDENNSVGGKTVGTLEDRSNRGFYRLELQVPGEYNFDNAVSAAIAAKAAGIPLEESVEALKSFRSTKRRFEKITEKDGVIGYDDYAHHPSELAAVIKALKQWHPDQRNILVFQPHTFSRTRELFADFVQALALADELILTDIFASARESADPETTSAKLSEAVKKLRPDGKIHYTPTITDAANLLRDELKSSDVFLTAGAGDIYQLHDML